MRFTLVLAAVLGAYAGGALAARTYNGFDSFYAAQPGAVFGAPINSDTGVAYATPGEPGIYTELHSNLNGRSVRIAVGANWFTVNGRAYRFARATTFPGEHASDIYPPSASVFLASGVKGRPPVLCVQGFSNGSGEADRYTQIYLVIDPLKSEGHAMFLHLPSLLSSCRAVVQQPDGQLAFPSNEYLFDFARKSRVGLRLSYYGFAGRNFAPLKSEIHLRFTQPEVPFSFTVEEKD